MGARPRQTSVIDGTTARHPTMSSTPHTTLRIPVHSSRVKRKMGLLSAEGYLKIGPKGLECTAGEGNVMGLPVPVKVGAMHFSLKSIVRVQSIGFGGPLFCVIIGADLQEYVFEATTQADRNIWVCAIQRWIRNPTGLVAAQVAIRSEPVKKQEMEPKPGKVLTTTTEEGTTEGATEGATEGTTGGATEAPSEEGAEAWEAEHFNHWQHVEIVDNVVDGMDADQFVELDIHSMDNTAAVSSAAVISA